MSEQTTVKHIYPHDLIPEFDCYLADVEKCLLECREDWAEYRKDPKPYIVDLLCDFGDFNCPAARELSESGMDASEIAELAARVYTGEV